MSTIQDRVSRFIVGFYAWAVTLFFGAVLLDTVYSNGVPEAKTAFSEVSDFLLIIGGITLLAAIAAIAFSWKWGVARNYFVASFVVLLFEYLVPVIFSQLSMNMEKPGLTTALRIIINGTASVLAMIGLLNFSRHQQIVFSP
jgi:hypothetical protein